jgi:hypothetical protein
MFNGISAGKADQTRQADLARDERQILPYEEPVRTWAGRGTGALCNLCGLSIKAQDIEYEVELLTAGTVRGLHFHFKCYRVWETQS